MLSHTQSGSFDSALGASLKDQTTSGFCTFVLSTKELKIEVDTNPPHLRYSSTFSITATFQWPTLDRLGQFHLPPSFNLIYSASRAYLFCSMSDTYFARPFFALDKKFTVF